MSGFRFYGTNYLSYPLSHGIDKSVDNYYGLNHRFSRLTQLIPNTVYYFVVRDDQGKSERMCFKTLPDNAGAPVTFIAGGDSRTAIPGEFADSLMCRPWRQDANRLVSKISPDFIAFIGDYVVLGTVLHCWKDWFSDWQLTITPEGRLFPLVPTLGNHEASIQRSWGAPLKDLFTYSSPDAAFKWTRNQEKMPGFQLVNVTREKIEVHVIKLENVSNVGQVGIDDPPGTLPSNIVLWDPSNGSVVTINHLKPMSGHEVPVGNFAAIYPNPASEEIRIDFPGKSTTVKVEVYNAYGGFIKSLSVNTNNTFKMDVSSFNTGIYYFHITSGNLTDCHKLLIVR